MARSRRSCCSRRRAATAPASTAPCRRSSARSSCTARPSTCARRSSTTSTWSSSCATAARCSSSPRPRCPRARRSCSPPTASPPASTPTPPSASLHTIDATCPLVTKVHVEAKKFAADGLHDRAHRPRRPRGGGGHDGGGARAHRPDRGRGRRRRPGGRATRRRSPTSPRRPCRSTRRSAIINRLRERFPAITGPRTDDICYATTNRQAAVKQLAQESDLVLVIGSRNSSNSNRLVEVAREHGADSYLIDNEAQVREEWLDGKRVVGITSGASAPEELVQRLVDFFRAAAPRTCGSSRSSRRTSASCSPRRSARRWPPPDGPDPGRRCARSSSPTCISGARSGRDLLREPRASAAR